MGFDTRTCTTTSLQTIRAIGEYYFWYDHIGSLSIGNATVSTQCVETKRAYLYLPYALFKYKLFLSSLYLSLGIMLEFCQKNEGK
jgi:hypothetical protein